MIVRILGASASFNGVNYNTEKIDKGSGELMKISGFGMLEGFQNLRPEDYKNALKAVSTLNKRVRSPQFHAAISAEGRSFDKHQLTAIAEKWLKAMGYGDQPYLVVFHRDTKNNHVHVVTTRIDKQGKKINSDFEYIRAVSAMNKIMGKTEKTDLEKAFAYRFTTVAQFKMLLEDMGYSKRALMELNVAAITAKFATNKPDPRRVAQLRAILIKYKDQDYLKEKHGIRLIFHAAENKPPYGYTIIDHAGKAVYKGSEVLPLKELLGTESTVIKEHAARRAAPVQPTASVVVNLQHDSDDEAVHGRKRKKKSKRA